VSDCEAPTIPSRAHLRISKISYNVTNTSFADWKTERQLSGCDASILAYDGVITLQHCRTNGWDRTACTRQITEPCFFCFGSLHSFHPATNSGSVDRSTSTNISKTSVPCFSPILSRQRRSLSEHVTCTVHHDRLHCEALLQWCYLSQIFKTTVHKFQKLHIYFT
jgi:hypothetical protein